MRIDKNSDVLLMLRIEHQRISQVLDLLERQIIRLENGEAIDYELIMLAIDYFLNYPDTCHHPKEDLIFMRVMTSSGYQPGVIGDLISEHRELSQLTHDVRLELSNIQSESSPVTTNLSTTLKAFLQTYRHHIETENTMFFPYVMENLSQEELDAVDFDLFDREDPVYDDETEEMFVRLRDEIMTKGNLQ